MKASLPWLQPATVAPTETLPAQSETFQDASHALSAITIEAAAHETNELDNAITMMASNLVHASSTESIDYKRRSTDDPRMMNNNRNIHTKLLIHDAGVINGMGTMASNSNIHTESPLHETGAIRTPPAINKAGLTHKTAKMASTANIHADPPLNETRMTQTHSPTYHTSIQTEPLIHEIDMIGHTGMTASFLQYPHQVVDPRGRDP